MSRVDCGPGECTAGDEVYTLTPTLDCVRKIKRWGYETPLKAIEACQGFDADTLAIFVAAGTGKGQRDFGPIAQALFDEGTINVTGPIITFLQMLLNPTGKDKTEDAEDEDKPEGE